MFGAAYFGKSFLGARYWGPAAGEAPPVEPVLVDLSSVGRVKRLPPAPHDLDEARAAEAEALRTAVMIAVEAEKMAAAMRAESEIAPPEPQFTQIQMIPVKFRGRK